VLKDQGREESARIRAAEVLVDLFDGLDAGLAETAWSSAAPRLRGRIAWAVDRQRLAPVRHALIDDFGFDDPLVLPRLLRLMIRGRINAEGDNGVRLLAQGLDPESPRTIAV